MLVFCVLYESGEPMIGVTKAAIVRFSFSAFKESVTTSCAVVVLSAVPKVFMSSI